MPRVKPDSIVAVTRDGHRIKLPREQLTQGVALAILLTLGGLALLGPSGLLAWSEQAHLLDQRKAQIARLAAEREELQHRVEALDPDNADPDLVATLLRQQLNVVRPDELVLELEPQDEDRKQ